MIARSLVCDLLSCFLTYLQHLKVLVFLCFLRNFYTHVRVVFLDSRVCPVEFAGCHIEQSRIIRDLLYYTIAYTPEDCDFCVEVCLFFGMS